VSIHIAQDLKAYYDPAADERMTSEEAIVRGLLRVQKTDSSSNKTSQKQAYDGTRVVINWHAGTVSDNNGRTIDISEALRRGVIDEATAEALLKNAVRRAAPKGSVLPSESVRMVVKITNLIDMGQQNSVMYEETPSSQSISSEQDDDFEPYEGRLSFSAAVRLGLYDIHAGRFRDPHTGKRLTLVEAIDNGIINISLAAFVSVNTGQTITLREAMERNLVVRDTGKINEQKITEEQIMVFPEFTVAGGITLPSINLEVLYIYYICLFESF